MHYLFICTHLSMSSVSKRGIITSLGLMLPSRADTRVPSSSLSVCLWLSSSPFCLFTVSSLLKPHSKQEISETASGGGWRELCVCVRVCGGRSAHHAQQINVPVPTCHGKAWFSRDIRWGETNQFRLFMFSLQGFLTYSRCQRKAL